MDTIIASLPILYFIGAVALGAGFLYIQWKRGGNEASIQVIETYKSQVSQLKEQIENFKIELTNLRSQIDKMRGTIEEKERLNKDLRAIIESRNPDVEAFYKEALPALRVANKYCEESKPIMESMKSFMERMAKNTEQSNRELSKQTQELRHHSEVLEGSK